MKSWKEKVAETAGISKDVSQGVSILRIIGQNEAVIENFRGIIEYTDSLIRIQIKGGQIYLEGKNLQIENYTNEEMQILGHIKMLHFHQGG